MVGNVVVVKQLAGLAGLSALVGLPVEPAGLDVPAADSVVLQQTFGHPTSAFEDPLYLITASGKFQGIHPGRCNQARLPLTGIRKAKPTYL